MDLRSCPFIIDCTEDYCCRIEITNLVTEAQGKLYEEAEASINSDLEKSSAEEENKSDKTAESEQGE